MTSFRQPNDGICPRCGHENGPHFGAFRCEGCGKAVASTDLDRRIQTMTVRQWLMALLGGLGLAAMLVLFGLATRGNG
ncbi:MAG: hypothetical protein OIF47_05335 [Marinibacterium sp.]|nr:hypothetical protein [Marinibacterium sp.]